MSSAFLFFFKAQFKREVIDHESVLGDEHGERRQV